MGKVLEFTPRRQQLDIDALRRALIRSTPTLKHLTRLFSVPPSDPELRSNVAALVTPTTKAEMAFNSLIEAPEE